MPQTLEEEEVEIVFCSEEDPPLKDFIELRFILKRLEYRNKFKDFLWDNTLQVTNMKDLDQLRLNISKIRALEPRVDKLKDRIFTRISTLVENMEKMWQFSEDFQNHCSFYNEKIRQLNQQVEYLGKPMGDTDQS